MKKHLFFVATICASMVMVSCGSSKESAYRKAYEKAKAQEQAQQTVQPVQQTQQYVQEQVQPVQQAPVVTPLVQAPAQQQTIWVLPRCIVRRVTRSTSRWPRV